MTRAELLAKIEAAGFAIVPKQVTPEMVAEAWTRITPEKHRRGLARLGPGLGTQEWWSAMLSVSPGLPLCEGDP